MIFWILIGMLVVIPLAAAMVVTKATGNVAEGIGAFLMATLMAKLFLGVPIFVSWGDHARDLGTIYAQQEVIAVYQDRVDRLNASLKAFDYPKGSLLNADTPVASIVASLTEAESQLAKAEHDRAAAIRSVEQRRRGPMSGVVTLVGDYK